MDPDLQRAATAVHEALADAERGLIERRVLVELVTLAAVAGEHVLVLGPPGTAKSEAVRRVARAFGGRYFEYLLGRFTEPSEIFGAVDLRKLREGRVETETTGMLPEAEVAFLDEVFLGSTAILNTLLAILNERRFRRGHTEMAVPLRVCVGAANALPVDESLGAFADRFLVRCFVDQVADPRLEELLEGGWELEAAGAGRVAPLAELDRLCAAARAAEMDAIRPELARAVRLLRAAGIALSDRRIVKTQKLVAAAAVMAGRARPARADLWPIIYAVPTAEGQTEAREALRELLDGAENPALGAAAEDASASPAARASRLVASGRALLAGRPDGGGDDAEGWRLRLESALREIDAGFAPGDLDPELRALREQLVAAAGAA